jgi:apolipoprotein N-acyltransferase
VGASSGVFSSLFLFSLGLYWISVSTIPDMGYLFILWGVVNLLFSVILMMESIRGGQRTRFD